MAIKIDNNNIYNITISQLINRIGVAYRDKYNRQPQTLAQKCAYFSVHQTIPGLTESGTDWEAMKRKANEFYNTLTTAEKEKLWNIYNNNIHFQRGFNKI